MFKTFKLLYQFLKKYFNLIRNKTRHLSINLLIILFGHRVDKNESNILVDMAANTLVGRELDEYLKSFKPSMPLLNYDPAIKSMKIEWNNKFIPINEWAQIKERLEEQIINKYVRYVSRHIFIFLQPNKHKILLNATAFGQLGTNQIPVGEQVLYKDSQQLENYLIDHLMGVLVSYEANGMEDFTYFISNIDEKQYQELSTKIEILFK